MGTRERILITVRTYPNLSQKHIETVCTGGITDQGEWRRLYPVPLRHLSQDKQYRTFDVVEVKVSENPDGRPESRRPDPASLKIVDHVSEWNARRAWVLPTALNSMAQMEASGRTLAPVRVRDVIDFVAVPDEANWSAKQQEMLRQAGLFDGPAPLEKVPFDFRLKWRDGDGIEHDSKFLAWEVGETWRGFRHRYGPDALNRVREAFMLKRFSADRDIWFFMGNYAAHRQHFGVCGVFSPPKEKATHEGTLWSVDSGAS